MSEKVIRLRDLQAARHVVQFELPDGRKIRVKPFTVAMVKLEQKAAQLPGAAQDAALIKIALLAANGQLTEQDLDEWTPDEVLALIAASKGNVDEVLAYVETTIAEHRKAAAGNSSAPAEKKKPSARKQSRGPSGGQPKNASESEPSPPSDPSMS